MTRLWTSVAFRLALGYGIFVISSMSVISAVLYFGTVGVLEHGTGAKLELIANRLSGHFRSAGAAALRHEIDRLLADGVDQDTEVYLLTGPDGRKLAGNLAGWAPYPVAAGALEDRGVIRDGRPSVSRLLSQRLADGGVLVVGRDMRDRREIEQLVWHALAIGLVVALLLAAAGALVFRRLLEARVATIRRTAREIEAGDLSRRIPVRGVEDEFSRLVGDINNMLDRIEHLMDGVRQVSNAIAHDLRTPLGRIRGALDEALRRGQRGASLAAAARVAIAEIDELIRVFDRLLQIAEAEIRHPAAVFCAGPARPRHCRCGRVVRCGGRGTRQRAAARDRSGGGDIGRPQPPGERRRQPRRQRAQICRAGGDGSGAQPAPKRRRRNRRRG